MDFISRKNKLENLIAELQQELSYVNEQIAKQETISKKAVIEEVKPKATKRPKLTPTQEDVMQSLYNAVPYYKDASTARYIADIDYTQMDAINAKTYIDGKPLSGDYKTDNNNVKRFIPETRSYIMGENRYAHEMDSKTLKALEKKGYLKIIEDNGQSMDLVELVENYEQPKIYTEMVKMTIEIKYDDSKYTTTTNIYCPEYQEVITFNKFMENTKEEDSYTIIEKQIVKVETWKF